MCGRFTLYADPDFLEEYFDLENGEDLIWEPRYNIAPGQDILALVQGRTGLRAGRMRWGLIPSWAKDEKIGYKMINARSETIHEKPSFRSIVNRRHCLIVANGFYEWKKEGGKKQPYFIHLSSGEPIVMAGLWDRWISSTGTEVVSCTILTTEANDFMRKLHHRMPVILDREKGGAWLRLSSLSRSSSSGTRKTEAESNFTSFKKKYFRALATNVLDAYQVSTFVNNAKNESQVCLERI
ncbi:SOS response-associated peptidase [Evansella tamaricis]|uniref:Abasic site processing protein n=1 Tax=Evansella tamaricis TaxID=2069301 RepID=A0ABS6JD28_9BACI|nr:SOS response-associated peptidase [Evansella tamaricis]MBU9711408.1 SOS response-associated peptidase [Evansella tamaricis]